MIDPGRVQEREPWEREPWVRELDALVRPALLAEPPPAVQQSILAAVLLAAAAQPTPVPVAAPQPADVPGRPLPLLAYLLLAAVLVAYVAGVSWLQGLFGNVTWLSILAGQLLTISDLVFGRPDTGEPLTLAWQLFVRAPWLALLPVAWLLWDRDRATAPTA
ncbi:MAG: hypothetical protein IT306_20605 [Chloroflexi bacterium]|nr:hypothetical protein [Chloroflexota bacterium]